MSYRRAHTCERCGREHVARAHTQRLCDECKVIRCAECGASITLTKDLGQRFCSSRCSALATVPRGRLHPSYNGGLTFNVKMGRWLINCRDGTQMLYYRGVMAAQLGRLLRPDELVHHVNEDPTDDRVGNLEITTRAEHFYAHLLKKAERRAAAA